MGRVPLLLLLAVAEVVLAAAAVLAGPKLPGSSCRRDHTVIAVAGPSLESACIMPGVCWKACSTWPSHHPGGRTCMRTSA